MPETRCVKVYEDGIPTGEENCRVVSDQELAIEAIERETAEINDQALVAYQHWGSLTIAQKDRVLKALLGEFISRHRSNYM